MPSMRPPKKVREPLARAGCGAVANGAGLPGLRLCHLVRISIATVSGTLAIAMLPDSIALDHLRRAPQADRRG